MLDIIEITKGIVVLMQDGRIINFPEGNTDENCAYRKTIHTLEGISLMVASPKGIIDSIRETEQELADLKKQIKRLGED